MGLENPVHIAIILVVLVALFGAKKLPEMGRGLGSGLREFKAGVKGEPGLSQPATDSEQTASERIAAEI